MLEITANTIQELNDSDLRTLVGLLCEAELLNHGIPTAGVTMGGHQDAPDGGIDVRVSVESSLSPDGYIPRSETGFQVKRQNMDHGHILKEMKPKGILRPAIRELAKNGGAYIIISSISATTDIVLKNRKQNMLEALEGDNNDIKLDFFDGERMAAWVRSHPSLILWVRQKIGKPIFGWSPYDNWAKAPGGVNEEYLVDADLRISAAYFNSPDGVSVKDGIDHIRGILRLPRKSIRLVGLSGVGKTRLVQALFDHRIGEFCLNPNQVYYTDSGIDPDPPALKFAQELVSLRKPGILIVDNCPPTIHRNLTDICISKESLISLITIEYDIREDQPEATDVFRLEPASIELIERLLLKRYPSLGQSNCRRIADFSGGNARLAISLAQGTEPKDSLSNFSDESLFLRMFRQGNEPNEALLKAAEICSLFYSFSGAAEPGNDQELNLLSELSGLTFTDLFSKISEIKRRGLIQTRGIWNAVLPQALANKLAERSLENNPKEYLFKSLFDSNNTRMLRSFSRRLGYLHFSPIANEICEGWLKPDGLLGNILHINDLGIAIFENIAPINPLATLSAIERNANAEPAGNFCSRSNPHFEKITRILYLLAYEPDLFGRAVELLIRFAVKESPEENFNPIRRLATNLFQLYFSCTHALPESRLLVIEQLLYSNDNERVELGLNFLSSSLECFNHDSQPIFDFGARRRDLGYWPKSFNEVKSWYIVLLRFTVNEIITHNDVSRRAKVVLGGKFRGLWIRSGIKDELILAANKIIEACCWNEGWLAVQSIVKYNPEQLEQKDLIQLETLRNTLEPNSLIELIKAYLIPNPRTSINIHDIFEGNNHREIHQILESKSKSFGFQAAENETEFNKILPELILSTSTYLYHFGQGLASGSKEPLTIWGKLKNCYNTLTKENLNYNLLCGFLNQLSNHNQSLCEQILDNALIDPIEAKYFPLLQASVPLTENGLARLFTSLENSTAPIYYYSHLSYRGGLTYFNDFQFSKFLEMMSLRSDGIDIALELLASKLDFFNKKTEKVSPGIRLLGQSLLLRISQDPNQIKSGRTNYLYEDMVRCFLNNPIEESIVVSICENLVQHLKEYNLFLHQCNDLLKNLAPLHPEIFLNVFFPDDYESQYILNSAFSSNQDVGRNLMEKIEDTLILSWCAKNPTVRFPIIANVITPFFTSETGSVLEWSSIANKIIQTCPDPEAVLDKFYQRFRPNSWSGSLPHIMKTRLPLITSLINNENSLISNWAMEHKLLYLKDIDSAEEWNFDRYHNEIQGFE